MLPTQNASSYILNIPSDAHSDISTEQQFVQHSKNMKAEQKEKLIIPYNMTPMVKLFEPVKTKFIPRDLVNQSIQYFNEPAEHSQAEIDLLDQSMHQSQQHHYAENYDPLQPVQMPQNDQITQYPQLFMEPPILIPYLMDYIDWDVNYLKMIASNDEDDVERYHNFYKSFKSLAFRIQRKYYTAKSVIDSLIEKYQLVQKLNDLQQELINQLNFKVEDLESQNLDQLKKHEWVEQQQNMEKLRRKIFQLRKECHEVLMLTEHLDDWVLTEQQFIDRLNELRAQLDHSYDLFEEQILIYIFHDAAGVETCLHYLRDGSTQDEESLDIKFFNGIPNFLIELDTFGLELRHLVKYLRLIIIELVQKTTEFLKQLNASYKGLQNKVKKINQLFNEIPVMVTKMKLSMNQARIILQRIRLPHNNYRDENQEIYDEYLKLQDENTKLEQLIQRRITTAEIINPVCEEQKNLLQLEITQMQEENQNVIELYNLMNSIQEDEFILSKIQSQRIEIWQRMIQTKSEEIQELNRNELKQLEGGCITIISQITQYFGQDKMPHQFIKLKLWAESELIALRVKLDAPKIHFLNLDQSLKQRVDNLIKWEFSQQEEGEQLNISQYIQYFNDLNHDLSTQQPEIEMEIDNQFETMQDLPELLELNETYTIWKNMQTAGIYLNDEYLKNLLSSKDSTRMRRYRGKVTRLKTFFSLMDLNHYVGYLTEVIQLIDHLLVNEIEKSHDLIENSKYIPRIYRKELLDAILI